MGLLWFGSVLLAWQFESQPNPQVQAVAGEQVAGGNMEGKEVRSGVAGSGVFGPPRRPARRPARSNAAHDSMTPVRRRRRAGEHDALRGLARRRGFRALRHPRPGDRGGVHRGAHGGPDARVPRQEDRAARDEAGLALHPARARDGPEPHGRWRSCMDSAVASIFNPGPHGLSEVLYAFTSGANNNGSAFGGLSANTTFFNTAIGLRDAVRPVRLDRAGAGGGRVAGPQEARCRARPGRSPRPPRSSWGCSTGVIIIVTALTYFPALSLGPIVEGLS